LLNNHKTIFSIVDEPPSQSDADGSHEPMSVPEKEGNTPDDMDSPLSGVGNWIGETREHQKGDSSMTFSIWEKVLSSAIGSHHARPRRAQGRYKGPFRRACSVVP
jgi:hypothetical protein